MNEIEYYLSTILLPPLEKLDSALQLQIVKYRSEIEWLLELDRKYDSIADFGCGKGNGTLALMLILGANETIGIDIDNSKIEQAKHGVIDLLLVPIQQKIQKIRDILPDSLHNLELSEDIRSRAESLIGKYENLSFPSYRKGDMIKGKKNTNLLSNHFDLAYCRYVLYYVYCDENERANENTRSAIREMARVVKTGGLIVAIEPDTCSLDDNTPVILDTFFKQADLGPVEVDSCVVLPEGTYLYSKAE